DYSPQMIEKSRSTSLALATIAILGQPPSQQHHSSNPRKSFMLANSHPTTPTIRANWPPSLPNCCQMPTLTLHGFDLNQE
ncbi:hypothetical protein, partial [Nitrosomonas sp. ANs5]|uniref:hypothetical protein n=1 Tax=Nitrosomonas sp. ANs5 TaxID=3423941 RepID=UPI003D34BCEB